MKVNSKVKLTIVISALLTSSAVYAAVSEAEAEKLGNELTPFGAERAGNADGTIPEWTGGIAKKPRTGGEIPADPFPEDGIEFSISANNMGEYGDLLTEGTKAILQTYPEFSVNVYQTRRTAAAPQYVYDNIKKNAVNAKLSEDGLTVSGVYGGIPFPIPQTGIELFWNHTLRFSANAYDHSNLSIVGSPDGSTTLTAGAENNIQHPYYNPDGSAEEWNGDYFLGRMTNNAPVFKAGESMVIRDNISEGRAAWQYLLGQRRVRRAPNIGYDTPDFVSSGANYFDEVAGFFGDPDRYNWNLIGKQEMIIPYNNNRFMRASIDEAFVAHYPNPDLIRWERHRVWVVEATLVDGMRHAVPKRVFYFDEDTGSISAVDGYDAQGQIWRASWTFNTVVPEIPSLVTTPTCIFDLQAVTYSCTAFFNDGYWKPVDPRRDSYFSGDSLAADATR